MFKLMGISPERVEMNNLSAAEGAKFAEFASEITKKIQKVGPNPLKNVKSRKVA